MNIERIRRRVAGAGFRPFALRTSDGEQYEVPHPEFIMFGRSTIAVLDNEQEVTTIDPLHIVAIKDLPVRKNGAS